MSRDNPRDDRWAEWYTFHPDVMAIYNEVAGGTPPHESLCPDNTSLPTRPEQSLFPDEPLPVADPRTHCWCNAFCGYCHHHTNHHAYPTEDAPGPTLCARCPGGVCPALTP